jgi:hypothetical protein
MAAAGGGWSPAVEAYLAAAAAAASGGSAGAGGLGVGLKRGRTGSGGAAAAAAAHGRGSMGGSRHGELLARQMPTRQVGAV